MNFYRYKPNNNMFEIDRKVQREKEKYFEWQLKLHDEYKKYSSEIQSFVDAVGGIDKAVELIQKAKRAGG